MTWQLIHKDLTNVYNGIKGEWTDKFVEQISAELDDPKKSAEIKLKLLKEFLPDPIRDKIATI